MKLDVIEHHQRRNNRRTFGIPENWAEDTDQAVLHLFKKKMKLGLSVDQLERSHRVGNPQLLGTRGETGPRPIIVRFRSYRDLNFQQQETPEELRDDNPWGSHCFPSLCTAEGNLAVRNRQDMDWKVCNEAQVRRPLVFLHLLYF